MPDFKSPRLEHWDRISHKPKTFPPSAHRTDWSEIDNVPSFPISGHTHVIADITNFPATWEWTKLTNVPATFTPSAHTHVIADVIGLQTALNGKSNVGHTHDWLDITGRPSTFSPSAHTHPMSDVTGLVSALAGKMDAPLVVGSPNALSPAFGTAYQAANPAKPSFISVMIDTAYTVTVASTQADTVELRIGSNSTQVAAGTGGFVAATFRSSLTGIALALGLGVGQRNQLTAMLPTGWFYALRRTQGTAATITSATDQSIG